MPLDRRNLFPEQALTYRPQRPHIAFPSCYQKATDQGHAGAMTIISYFYETVTPVRAALKLVVRALSHNALILLGFRVILEYIFCRKVPR